MMNAIPMEHGLLLAAALFALGFAGLILRRNILFMLMSVEIMMNATALAFIVAGSRWASPDGQVMFVLVLTLAAAEACVGLALVIQLSRRFRTLDIDAASTMKG
jgi:NADH-quinone oxidoreductase subunit K